MIQTHEILIVGLLTIVGTATQDSRADEPFAGDKARMCFAEGLLNFQNGDYEKALVSFTQSITISPTDWDAYVKRGDCYLSQHDYPKATSDFSAALRLNPKSYDGYVGRAISRLASDPKSRSSQEQARLDLFQAMNIDPERADAHLVKYHLYKWQTLGKSQKSVANIEFSASRERDKALANDPSVASYTDAHTLAFVRLRRNAGEKERLAQMEIERANLLSKRQAQREEDQNRFEQAQQAQFQLLAEQVERANQLKASGKNQDAINREIQGLKQQMKQIQAAQPARTNPNIALPEKQKTPADQIKTFKVTLASRKKPYGFLTRYVQAENSSEAARMAGDENKDYIVTSTLQQR